MKFTYDSNNSGGVWWLKDKDWYALDKAGWKVHWVDRCGSRWLGALATSASKEFETLHDCVREFESITAQDVTDEGYACCGPPHSFNWGNTYVSGESILEYLYPEKGRKTLREFYEEQE